MHFHVDVAFRFAWKLRVFYPSLFFRSELRIPAKNAHCKHLSLLPADKKTLGPKRRPQRGSKKNASGRQRSGPPSCAASVAATAPSRSASARERVSGTSASSATRGSAERSGRTRPRSRNVRRPLPERSKMRPWVCY